MKLSAMPNTYGGYTINALAYLKQIRNIIEEFFEGQITWWDFNASSRWFGMKWEEHAR